MTAQWQHMQRQFHLPFLPLGLKGGACEVSIGDGAIGPVRCHFTKLCVLMADGPDCIAQAQRALTDKLADNNSLLIILAD